jgi:hypothetical protein
VIRTVTVLVGEAACREMSHKASLRGVGKAAPHRLLA